MSSPEVLGRMLGYQHLTSDHGEWIKDCWLTDDLETTFQAYRGSFKTTTRIVIGCIYRHLMFPNETILLVRKTDAGAKKILKEIKALYKHPVMRWIYREIYGIEEPLSEERSDAIELTRRTVKTKEASIQAIGLTTSITGDHYNWIIADDIVTREDRYYAQKRETTKEVVRDFRNIAGPTGKIRYHGTPWHKDDAFSIMPKPTENRYFPIGTIHVYGADDAYIAKIKATTPRALFAANYELKHVEAVDPEFENPNMYDPATFDREKLTLRAAIDPAFDGKDHTALVIGGVIDGGFRVVYGNIWRKNVADIYGEIERILRVHKVHFVICEKNQAQVLVVREFARRGFYAKGVKSVSNKFARITDALKKTWQRIYFSTDVNTKFMDQVLEFNENADKDDAPDALAMLISSFKSTAKSKKLVMR